MPGLKCDRRVLRKTREAGELYELWVEQGENALVVGEDSEGPLTETAFGESWHRSMVRVCAELADYEDLLASSDAPLCDLMDLLDERGVAYSYMGVGSKGVVTLRGERPKMDFSQTLDVQAGT